VPRHPFVALREASLLLVVDFQQAMLKVMDGWEQIARRVNQLTRAADVLGVPIVLTEQYKKGLGGTIPEVLGGIASPLVFEKDHFSACLEKDFLPLVSSFARETIVLVGMETHVCVLQTGLDLIRAGFKVHLAADAVGSRSDHNRDIAIELFRQAGAVITSTETVIFQWARRANTEEFRKVLPIVK